MKNLTQVDKSGWILHSIHFIYKKKCYFNSFAGTPFTCFFDKNDPFSTIWALCHSSCIKLWNSHFIALILPIQWTIANPVGTDRPAKRQKKTSCVPPAGRSVVLCTPQMAPRTSFLSRQPDVIASFSFGACTVQTCFQQSPDIFKEKCALWRIFNLIFRYFTLEVLSTCQARIYIIKSAGNTP